jgi:hypothetical protein
MTNTKFLHGILGASLLLVTFFVVGTLLLYESQASEPEVEVGNEVPTFVADPVVATSSQGSEAYSGSPGTINNLTAGSDRTVYIYGVVEDLNGQDDFTAMDVGLYKTAITCAANGNNDPNNCYWNNDSDGGVGACTFVNNANTNRKDYECSFDLASWMDATDDNSGGDASNSWTLKVNVYDETATATNTNRTFEVSSLVSLNIGAVVDFGTLALNTSTTSASNYAQLHTQQGNIATDVKVSMTDATMNCSASTTGIDRENLRWALTDVDYGSGTAISSSPVDTDIAVAKRLTPSAPTKNLFWNISIPYGVEGTCSSTITMTAYNANL